jgi:hypothetical protein
MNTFPQTLVGDCKGFHFQAQRRVVLESMAIKLGWSPLPDEQFGFGGGSMNSPFEVDRYWIGVDFMVKKKKENIFLFL